MVLGLLSHCHLGSYDLELMPVLPISIANNDDGNKGPL
jgi:hypothetical protein